MATANPFTGGAAALSDIPVELQPQLQQANRQQQMADLLMQQGLQGQPQGQMISGHYVAPSWSQQLAPVANQALGLFAGYQADKAQTDLAAALRGKQDEIMQKWATATPAEKFALGTSPYAPKQLQAVTWDRLKPQKLGEGEVISEYDMGKGTYTPTAQGGEKMSPDVRTAAQTLGINKPINEWTPQDLNAINRQIATFNSQKGTHINMSNLLGKSVLNEVGPMLVSSKAGATGAVQQADAANRIISAVDTNKIFTGAGANQKLQIAQVGQMLGATGNTADEKINNTRQAIQGLAQLTLQGRQQMKGQGAVTESEGALAQRAISGDINFTAGEIKQLAEAAKRSGKFVYGQHQQMLGALEKDQPSAVPYYQINANPSIFEPKPVAGQSQTVNNALNIVRGTNGGAQ